MQKLQDIVINFRKKIFIILLQSSLAMMGFQGAQGHTQILEDFTIIKSGGVSGKGFSLSKIGLRKFKNSEEISIEIGDAFGNPYSGSTSYHRLTWNPKTNKGLLFLSQIFVNKIKDSKVRSLVKGSRFLKKMDLFFDPFDQTNQLRFELKQGTRVKLTTQGAKESYSRIVIELRGG